MNGNNTLVFQVKNERTGKNNGIDESCDLANILSRCGELVDQKEAARRLGLGEGTLAVWRSTGRYQLPFVKIGRKVKYRIDDLDAWIAGRTRSNGATGEKK